MSNKFKSELDELACIRSNRMTLCLVQRHQNARELHPQLGEYNVSPELDGVLCRRRVSSGPTVDRSVGRWCTSASDATYEKQVGHQVADGKVMHDQHVAEVLCDCHIVGSLRERLGEVSE